jgi:hypothetical protein
MIRSIARSLPLLAATLAGSAAAQTAAPAAPVAPARALPPAVPTPVPAARPEAPSGAPGVAPPEPAQTAPAAAPAAPAATPAPVAAEHVVLTESPPPASPVAGYAPMAPPPPPRFALPVPADVPPPPRPKGPVESRFNVGLNLDAVWYTRPSYDLFSKKDVAQNTGLSVGYAVLLHGPLSVVPEIGFGVDSQSTSGLYAGAIQSTTLDTKRFYGGVSVRYALLSFLDPHARLAGGASVIDATIAPGAGDAATGAASVAPSLTDTKASPFASLGAGFTLHTPAAALETNRGALRSLVFGVAVEGGYVLAKSVDLAPSPEHPSGRIRTVDAPLGTLERSGPYFRASIVARF